MTVATNAQPFITQPTNGNETLSQAQWLEALSRILPLSQLTVFGAGKGKSTVIDWAAANGVKNVSLIEGNKGQYEHLVTAWQASQPQWQLHNQVMQASNNQESTFYTASLPAESGVLAPGALNALWPNISETQRHPCEPKGLSSWAATHWQNAGQWLFIDYFCEADLLNASQDAFKNVDVLMIRVSTADQMPKALTAKAWGATLEKAGFSVVHRESERHPHIEHWLCIKSPTKTQSTLEQELAQNNDELAQVKEKLKSTHNLFMDRKQQALDGEERIKALTEDLASTSQALDNKDAIVKQLSEQLTTLQKNNERFAQLEGKLESLFGEQKTYIQQTTNALGQHVTRSAREQRDEQALTHYLQHGQRPLNTHLAPGFAMALLEHYETTQHDVVVVFGSADVTELIALAMLNARAMQPRLENAQREEPGHNVSLSNADLPQAVISIEHQKATCKAQKQALGNKQLAQAVSVVHAPWIECQAVGQSALFYAADATLQRLNQWLPDDASVLVVVGEALPEAGHSREVTLPVLLQQLPTHRLDIVLHNNRYQQEAGLKANWDALLDERQRQGQWLTLPNTHSLRVNG